MDIDLNELLANLEKMRHSPRFTDPEDRALMMQYEIIVSNYEALKVLKQNPMFVALLNLFEKEIVEINGWLASNTRDLLINPDPVKHREAMYRAARKDVLAEFLETYRIDPVHQIERIKTRVDKFIKP